MSNQQIENIVGRTAYDANGEKVGKIGTVYLDDETGQPSWVTVETGLFGGKESFVPFELSDASGDDVRLAHDKDRIKDAPRVAADGHITPEEEDDLYRYYGMNGMNGMNGMSGQTGTGTVGDVESSTGTVGDDTSGPTTDDAMTRSEEQLHVGTERREAGRARLRKYVVTENVTTTVPVSREEVRVEREPITEGNVDAAMDGPAISEEEHEVVLTEERPVVEKEAVPVERVRLGKETVTEEREVSDEVRKEQIDADGVDLRDSDRTDADRR